MGPSDTCSFHSMFFLGIDPGITGGVVILNDDGTLSSSIRTPVITDKGKKHFDIPGMVEVIDSIDERVMCGIEKVGTLPRDGRVGAFNFGRGYGLWLGILGALRVPYAEIPPQRWQAKMLTGLPRGPQTKTSAVQRAKSLFPDLPIRVKADWGMADAALIAAFQRLTHSPL